MGNWNFCPYFRFGCDFEKRKSWFMWCPQKFADWPFLRKSVQWMPHFTSGRIHEVSALDATIYPPAYPITVLRDATSCSLVELCHSFGRNMEENIFFSKPLYLSPKLHGVVSQRTVIRIIDCHQNFILYQLHSSWTCLALLMQFPSVFSTSEFHTIP